MGAVRRWLKNLFSREACAHCPLIVSNRILVDALETLGTNDALTSSLNNQLVTERMKMSKTLIELEETKEELRRQCLRYQALSKATDDIGIAIHHAGRILVVNPGFEQLTGYTEPELLADPEIMWSLFTDQDVQEVRTRIANESTKPYNADMKNRNGTVIPVSIHTKYQDYNGNGSCRVAIILTETWLADRLEDHGLELVHMEPEGA